MKVYPLENKQGQVYGLEIEKPARGRRQVCTILSNIEGVKITREPRFLSRLREESFCEFVLGDTTFSAEEPFGDNSRYWIATIDGTVHPELSKIVEAFKAAGRW